MSYQFPRVVAFGVAKPLDQVLQLFPLAMTSVAADGLDLILFSASHEVRWRSGIVFSVFFCFTIRGKEGGVKHGVDRPLVGERKLVRYWGDHLSDCERPMPPWGQLDRPVREG